MAPKRPPSGRLGYFIMLASCIMLLQSCATAATSCRCYYQGVLYHSTDEVLAAVQHDMDTQLAAVQPVDTPLGGQALLILPAAAPAVGSQTRAESLRSEVAGLLGNGNLAALRKSRLFDDVAVERRDVPPNDNERHDFAIWRVAGQWAVRYRDGDPIASADVGPNTLAAWIARLRPAADEARSGKGRADLHLHFNTDNSPPGFPVAFGGVPYDDTAKLGAAVRAGFAKRWSTVSRPADRLGGKALIVAATPSQTSPMTLTLKGEPPGVTAKRSALLSAYNAAESAEEAEGIRRSQLFDSVVVRTEDIDQPPAASGFDYVLFQLARKPFWQFLGPNGAVKAFEPKGDPMPVEWIAALRDQLRHPNDAKTAATSGGAGAGGPDLGLHTTFERSPAGFSISFMDTPYDDPAKLADAVRAAYAQQWDAPPALTERLGGKALIVVATETEATLFSPNIVGERPAVHARRLEFLRAYNGAMAAALADGVKRSRLFDSVVIRTEDTDKAPASSGFDYVLFQMAGQPMPWHFLGPDGAVHVLVANLYKPPSDGWIAALRAQLKQPIDHRPPSAG
jgi:hypothetical protein